MECNDKLDVHNTFKFYCFNCAYDLSNYKEIDMQQKTLILITGFILFILISALYGYFQSTPGVEEGEKYPVAVITPDLHDFGEIEYGEIVEYIFKLTNEGDEVLEIRKVATSCGCTTAETSKEVVNPGETIDLSVRYDTGAMSGPHGMGEQERIIYIKTNDPINPQTEVKIKANVK